MTSAIISKASRHTSLARARALAALAASSTLVAPALAVACPSARAAACGSCSGHSSLGGYLVAVGIGLLTGAASVGLERAFRSRD